MPKLVRENDQLELTLKGHPDFKAALEQVKMVPGRRFDGDRKLWCFPDDPLIAERVMVTVKPDVDAALLMWVREAKKEKEKELVTPLQEDAELVIPWANDRVHWQPEFVGPEDEQVPFTGLYDFQRAFVDWSAKHPDLLLADDMGLGKCGQSCSAVIEHQMREAGNLPGVNTLNPDVLSGLKSASEMLTYLGIDDGPKLIIAPNSVKGTWGRELRMWLGPDTPIQIIDATTFAKRQKQLKEGIERNAWCIVNWEYIRAKKEEYMKKVKVTYPSGDVRIEDRTAARWVLKEPLLGTTPWIAVIADEAHRAKNRKSLQTRGLFKIKADMKLALTGTPLMNSPDELWSLLRWLYPEQYTAFWTFYDDYVDAYETSHGRKIVTGVKNPDALRFELSTRLVRRTKAEVLSLPDKTRQIISVTLPAKQRKLYQEAEKQMWFEVEQAIKEGDKNAVKFAEAALKGGKLYQVPNGAARLVRLQQIASTPALLGGEDESIKLDTAEEIILDNQPKQFVVFTKFVKTAELLVERLKAKGIRAAAFSGHVDSQARTELENEFQAGDIDVLVGTIAAMREGITLTAASDQIWLERDWTPANNEQGEDRCHRTGQRHPVTILIIQAEDTVDTNNVAPTNALKSLIVGSVISKDHVHERETIVR